VGEQKGGKCGGCAENDHVLIRGDLLALRHGCLWQSGRRVHKETRGVSSGACERTSAAPDGNKEKKPAGERQESAKAIVAKHCRETCGHDEGPNIINREEL
jgi:hypothetical protein